MTVSSGPSIIATNANKKQLQFGHHIVIPHSKNYYINKHLIFFENL